MLEHNKELNMLWRQTPKRYGKVFTTLLPSKETDSFTAALLERLTHKG